MADRVQYLEYGVYLASKELAENYQAAYPNGVRIAPDALATQLGIPVVLHTVTTPFFNESIRSPWFTATSKYPRNVAEFSTCRGGWFGICALFGRTTVYKWVAKYYWVTPPVPTKEGVAVAVPPVLQQRSWVDGFEADVDNFYSAWGGGNPIPISRAASRHVDGFGLAIRGLDDSGERRSHLVTDMGATARSSSWERFYLRVRRAPTGAAGLWQCTGATSSLSGIHLEVAPGLQLLVWNVDNLGARTLIATSTGVLVVNQWTKLDLVIEYGTGRFRIYAKGALFLDVTAPAAVGLGQAQNHAGSSIGNVNSLGSNLEADVDDWICATIPPTLDGLDWLNGSKVQVISPTGFGAGNTWAGDYRGLLRTPTGTVPPTGGGWLTNAVAGSSLQVTTDAEFTVNKCPGSLGVIAIAVSVRGSSVTDAAASVGYKFGAAAAVMTVTAEGVSAFATRQVMYRPSGLTAPNTAITPLELHYTRGAAAGNIFIYAFLAQAELIGTFGTEDVIDEAIATVTATPLPKLGLHNAPYPRSIWGRLQTPATAPVILVAGTYVGNGTGLELTFRAPVNWFFSRSTSVDGMEGNWWWTSQNAAHALYGQGLTHDVVMQAAEDVTFTPIGGDNDPEERYVVRIAGNGNQWNVSGRTYQYVAVIDPGARFSLNGLAMHHANAPGATDALVNTTFLPAGVFLQQEFINIVATMGFGFKGPGNSAAGMHQPGVAETASFLTLATGSLAPGTNFALPEGVQVPYSAWRMDDGSADPNVHKVVKIGSYVGNGSATRTVTLAPASGLRPVLALVMPVAAANWIHRDPSHTGTTSVATDGNLNAATGIIAGGLDEFTVGSVLNTNAVTFNYFVLLGSATAGNGGWSINGEFAQVEPDYPFDGPGDPGSGSVDPSEPVPGPVDPTLPVEPPDDTDDCGAGETCVTQTTGLINQALLEIGVTQFLTNYCTQQTKEAIIARLLYEVSVRAVLHDFPWPFATKYATLVLSSTQPTHADWTYAYIAPADCIFPRRIVVPRGMADNPEPPSFGLSSRTSGQLIFCNEPNAVLEYTMRPSCVAFTSDDLFRQALKWHLAAALAPPLTRMTAEATRCTEQYRLALEKANSIIKPGVPGLRAAAATVDVAAACVTANVTVVNRALIRIGAQTIANLTTEQSRESVAAQLIFEVELRAILRDYSWAFAKRYDDALVLVGGTATVPVNPDWSYSYRLPATCVKVRRLVRAGTGRAFDRTPIPFAVGTDATGGLLFTHETDPAIEYTARIECAVDMGDELFTDAFAWRLAAALAPSLAQVEPLEPEQRGRGPEAPPDPRQRVSHKPNQAAMRQQVARQAWAMYQHALTLARIGDANEAQPEKDGEAEWIEGRG